LFGLILVPLLYIYSKCHSFYFILLELLYKFALDLQDLLQLVCFWNPNLV